MAIVEYIQYNQTSNILNENNQILDQQIVIEWHLTLIISSWCLWENPISSDIELNRLFQDFIDDYLLLFKILIKKILYTKHGQRTREKNILLLRNRMKLLPLVVCGCPSAIQ